MTGLPGAHHDDFFWSTAWHGGWCWRHVAPSCGAPASVFTPTARAWQRAHLARPGSTSIHIQTWSRCSRWRTCAKCAPRSQLRGMVVTGAADRAPSASAPRLLDAFVPENRQVLLDYVERAVPSGRALSREGERSGGAAPVFDVGL